MVWSHTTLRSTRRTEEKSNGFENTPLKYYGQILGPQVELEPIVVTMIEETFGYRLIRKEKGTSEPHFWVGTFFFPIILSWIDYQQQNVERSLFQSQLCSWELRELLETRELHMGARAGFGLSGSQRGWADARDQRNSAWLVGARLRLQKRGF